MHERLSQPQRQAAMTDEPTGPSGAPAPNAATPTGAPEPDRGAVGDEHQAFLLGLSDAMRPLDEPDELQRAAMRRVAEHLGADRASFYELGPDEDSFIQTAGYETHPTPLPPTMRLSDFGDQITAEYRAGRTLVVTDTEVDPRFAGKRGAYRAIAVRAWVGVPLVKHGRLVAILGVHMAAPHSWTPSEVRLLEDVAERCWSAFERGRAEAALRESEARARRAHALLLGITEATDDLVAALDTDLRFVAFNSAYRLAFEQLFGPRIELGTSLIDALAHLPDDQRRAVELWQRALAGEVVGETQEFGDPQRTRRYFDLRFGPIRDESGAIIGAGEFASDVTERVLGEQALRDAKRELERADQRKDEFLAVLSHELRNPLAPIANSLYVLDQAPPDSPAAAQAKRVIARQVAQMSDLINDLLDITRISRNEFRLHRAPLELGELVHGVVEDHRELLERAGIELRLDPPTTPLVVVADRTRVAQIVGNLLHNSAKFTDPGGRVGVSVTSEGREAVVRVVDSGIGIAPAALERIFEPFAQAEQGLDRKNGGLGIGLALVKGLVERHGGSVQAHSEGLERGAELVVRLPLAPLVSAEPAAPPTQLAAPRGPAPGELAGSTSPVAVAEPAPRAAGPAPTPRRIVVIEDNPDAAESLRDVLALLGHAVTVAYTGPDGVAEVARARPDVVLCDLGLPGMDGYAVAKAVRADPALGRVAMFALSGYARPEDRRRAAEAGFDGHLAKPASLATLRRALDQLDAS